MSPEHGHRPIQLDKLRIQVLRVELIDFGGNILVSVQVVACEAEGRITLANTMLPDDLKLAQKDCRKLHHALHLTPLSGEHAVLSALSPRRAP